MKKLSQPMVRLILNIAQGRGANYNCRTRSDYGGLEKTIRAAFKRGWLTKDSELTPSGEALAAALEKGAKR